MLEFRIMAQTKTNQQEIDRQVLKEQMGWFGVSKPFVSSEYKKDGRSLWITKNKIK